MKNKQEIKTDYEGNVRIKGIVSIGEYVMYKLGIFKLKRINNTSGQPLYDVAIACPVSGCIGILMRDWDKLVCFSKKCKFKTTPKELFGDDYWELIIPGFTNKKH